MQGTKNALSTKKAAEWLHKVIPGESPKRWETALINNRRGDRKPPHRVPFTTVGRGAYYTIEHLREFAEFEKTRRIGEMKVSGRAAELMAAMGVGQPGGSTTGRRWEYQLSPQPEEGTGNTVIQLVTQNPLRIWRLELGEARAFAKELMDLIGVCERASHAS
jgi:hypothetical protein